MYLTAGQLWQTWLPPKAIDSLKSGGFYKIDLAGRQLQLVAINTALYLESNMVTRHNYPHDPANRWHWLQNSPVRRCNHRIGEHRPAVRASGEDRREAHCPRTPVLIVIRYAPFR